MGPQWEEGALIFAWLALACLGQLATGPLTLIFVSQDRAREAMISSVATSLYSSVAFLIGLPWGATGVAAAYAVSELIRTPVMLWYATRSGPVSFAETGRALVPFLLATPLCYVTVALLADVSAGQMSALAFEILALPISYAVTLPCLLVDAAGRECLAENAHAVRSTYRRAVPAT
jgi:PST family polysaccharide transporter